VPPRNHKYHPIENNCWYFKKIFWTKRIYCLEYESNFLLPQCDSPLSMHCHAISLYDVNFIAFHHVDQAEQDMVKSEIRSIVFNIVCSILDILYLFHPLLYTVWLYTCTIQQLYKMYLYVKSVYCRYAHIIQYNI